MTNPLTNKLDELEKLCETATDGWVGIEHEHYHSNPCTPDGCPGHDTGKYFNIDGPMLSQYGDDYETKKEWDQCHNDVKFITESRDAMPKLIKALRKADTELKESTMRYSRQRTIKVIKEIQQILCGEGES